MEDILRATHHCRTDRNKFINLFLEGGQECPLLGVNLVPVQSGQECPPSGSRRYYTKVENIKELRNVHAPILLLLIGLLVITGCCKQEPVQRADEEIPIVIGETERWDLGSHLMKNKLPDDMFDAYLQLGNTTYSSYGVVMAHDAISARSHDDHDMVLYGHRGTADFTVDEQTVNLSVGDVLFIPQGAIYSAKSTGSQPLQFFAVFTPAFDGMDVTYYKSVDSLMSADN